MHLGSAATSGLPLPDTTEGTLMDKPFIANAEQDEAPRILPAFAGEPSA